MANVALNRVASREWSKYSTVAEICQYTGFDGYGNDDYWACMDYLNSRDGSNATYEAIIWDVQAVYKTDITGGCQLYLIMKVGSIGIKVKDIKKIFYIICLITSALFVGVLILSYLVTDSTNNSKNKEIEKTEFFKITRSESGYFYCIYDKKHNIVKSEGPLIKKTNIKLTDDNLVEFTLQTGTGRATQWGYFYDIENNVFSPYFTSIYDQNNGIVIYGEPNKLIVRDIFDKKKYYKEIFAFSRPLSDTADSIIDAKFIEDNSIIKISYLTGEDFEVVTENIILSE